MASTAAKRLKHCLNKWLFFTLRHKIFMSAVLLLALFFSFWASGNAQFENDIARMLPDGSEAETTYRKIRSCAMFNKAMVLLETDEPEIFSSAEFEQKFDAFARGLVRHTAYIKRVDHRLFKSSRLFDPEQTLPYAMQLCTPDVLPDAEKLPGQVMKKLISPLSLGRSRNLHLDPPELSGMLFGGLNHFRKISMINTAPDSPWIMSSNRKYVLLTAECALELSDPRAAGILQTLIDEEFARCNMPQAVKKTAILPHKRAEINEKIIKKDVQLAAVLTLLLFGLLTLIFYRGDLRSLLIALLTFPAGLLSVGLLTTVFETPQLFVLGLGGVVTGIAVDYGIHIYGAMNTRMPYRTLTNLFPSLLIGMLTSASAFLIFVFSPMEGVRQLGLFAGSALVFSLFLMLFLLPWILKNKPSTPEMPLHKIRGHLQHPRVTVALFVLLAAGALVMLPNVKINSDVRQYDMSPASYDQAEQLIPEIFQNNRISGIALIEGRTAEEVLTHAHTIRHPDIFTIAELFPPQKIRQQNLEAWQNFDLPAYRAKLRTAGLKAGFPENYFDKFLEIVEKNRSSAAPALPPSWLENIKKRLLVKGSDGRYYTLVMYRNTPAAEKYLRDTGSCTVISRERIPRVMAQDIMQALLPTAIAAIAAVLLLCRIYFNSTAKACTALLPVIYSLIICLGLYALIGKGINIPVMAACVILCGLGVDYGIFVLHAIDHKRQNTVFHSITVSAGTTLAGGITVAFASSPMLHDAGITLIIGITVVWATALFLLPCLYNPGKNEI